MCLLFYCVDDGLFGKVVSSDAGKQRYIVMLEDGQQVCVCIPALLLPPSSSVSSSSLLDLTPPLPLFHVPCRSISPKHSWQQNQTRLLQTNLFRCVVLQVAVRPGNVRTAAEVTAEATAELEKEAVNQAVEKAEVQPLPSPPPIHTHIHMLSVVMSPSSSSSCFHKY